MGNPRRGSEEDRLYQEWFSPYFSDRRIAQAIFERLTELQFSVLVDYYGNGKPFVDIALLNGVTCDAVRNRFKVAVEKLRKIREEVQE